MEPDRLSSGSLSIDIAVQSELWDAASKAKDEDWVAAQLAPVLKLEGIRRGELSIALLDDSQMTALNSQYRGKDGPTNVLSFPAGAPLLGDIALCYETIAREAADKGASFEGHLSHLLIHGFLHLQGYDHQTEAEAIEMETLEINALAQLHIDNPYENTRLE